MEATGPPPNVHSEEGIPKPLPLEEFCSLVAKINSAGEDNDDESRDATVYSGNLVSRATQVNPEEIDGEDDHDDHQNFFGNLARSKSRRKTVRTVKVTDQPFGPYLVEEKTLIDIVSTVRKPGRPSKITKPRSEKQTTPITRQSDRLRKRNNLSLKKATRSPNRTDSPARENIVQETCSCIEDEADNRGAADIIVVPYHGRDSEETFTEQQTRGKMEESPVGKSSVETLSLIHI